MIIGLTGPMGSGKTTIIGALEKLGYKTVVTLSSMIIEEADKRGLGHEREQLMEVGQSLRHEFGAGVLAERAIEKIEKSEDKNLVIDGIRNPAEVEVLRKHPDFVLVANTAPEQMIIDRIMSRKRDVDTLDPEAIRHKLRREMGEGEPPDGQQLGKCIELADHVFENTMEFEEVEDSFIKFYNENVK